jgi:APA family basic amino acid/polyamine antiporter
MTARSLERRLGPFDAAAIVIGNVIGVGIFTTPGFVATIVPDPRAMLAVWVCGGVLAFLGALAYAELAARRPLAGGEYVYVRESFGELAAFLTGWTAFVAGFSGAIAAGAVGVTLYLDRFIPGAAHSKAVAIAIIGLLAVVHMGGLGPGRTVQMALTLVKGAALVTFVIIGSASAGHDATAALPRGDVPMSALLFAMVPVMFSYSGWNAAAYIAEEVREPSRNVPLGLTIGTVAVVAVYVSMNALYARAIVPDRVFGASATSLFNAVAVVIMLSSLSAMTLAGPRVYFAMARDGVLFAAAARMHDRYRTPVIAIAAQAAWSAVLVVSGTFAQLLTYTGFAVILFSALAVLSLFVVRERDRDARPFRAWGYPWAPAIFCLVSFAIVANAIVTAPRPAIAGVAVILGGLPIYWWKVRSRSTADRRQWTDRTCAFKV